MALTKTAGSSLSLLLSCNDDVVQLTQLVNNGCENVSNAFNDMSVAFLSLSIEFECHPYFRLKETTDSMGNSVTQHYFSHYIINRALSCPSVSVCVNATKI
eukprot:scaffold29475_cov85-Cyclotella_meneghiniana.AAC.2